MKILLPFGKTGIPLEIAEDKIPQLLEKVIPAAMKHMGALQEMGVDVNPMIRKLFGAPDPIAAPAVAAVPVAASAVKEPTEDEMTKAGYWKHTDGRWYPGDLQTKQAPPVATVPQPQPTPTVRVCGTCIRGVGSTNAPATPYNPPCMTCCFDQARPSWLPKTL